MAKSKHGAGEWWRDNREHNVSMARFGAARATVYARAAGHVLKLELVLAVGCNASAPVITISALEWAKAVVECSMVALFKAMEDRVADGERHADYLWAKRLSSAPVRTAWRRRR